MDASRLVALDRTHTIRARCGTQSWAVPAYWADGLNFSRAASDGPRVVTPDLNGSRMVVNEGGGRPSAGHPDPPATTWWAREVAALAGERPRLHALALGTWSRPFPILPLVAFVAVGAVGAMEPAGDARWFRTAGVEMIGPGFWDVLSDPGLQIGPLYLLALGILTRVVLALQLPVLFTVAGVQGAAVVALAVATARRLAADRGMDPRPVQWAVGLMLAVGGLLADATLAGHPEEVFVALILVGAARSVRHAKGWSASAWLALACAIKLWGVLGAPLMLLDRPPVKALVGRALLLGSLTALCYGSFGLLGTVSTFEHGWIATEWSPPSMLASRLEAEGWSLRLVQGGAVGLVGCMVAWRTWTSPLMLVLALLATRLALDPLNLSYYKGPVLVVFLLWVWVSPVAPRRGWKALLTTAVPLVCVLPFASDSSLVPPAWFVLLLVVPAWMLYRERSARSVDQDRTRTMDDACN